MKGKSKDVLNFNSITNMYLRTNRNSNDGFSFSDWQKTNKCVAVDCRILGITYY